MCPYLYPRHTYSESAGIKQNQMEWRSFKIRATFGREFQTLVTLEVEWRRNGNSLYISGYAIRWCSELCPDSFEGQSECSDCIRAAFEWQSKDSDGIRIAFQLNSFNIEIDSRSNRDAFEVHSGSFEVHLGHSGRIWSGLPFRFSLEGNQNVSNVVGMP